MAGVCRIARFTNVLASSASIVCLAATSAAAQASSSAGSSGAPRFASPPSLPPTRGYSQLVEVPAGSKMVFIAGQVPLDSTGAVVGAGDFVAQSRQVFENLKRALAAAGATFADVVKLNYYVLDASQLPALRTVRDQYISAANPPASTLAEVRRLFRDDVLLEVEAVAVVRQR